MESPSGSSLCAFVHEAIQDGVGQGAIGERLMPLTHAELTGHERGFSIVAIIEDLEQIALERIGEAGGGQIVEHQKIGASELL